MTDDNVFKSKEEELQQLTQEITEIKFAIMEISAAVGRIERHVKRSFGIPTKTEGIKPTSPAQKERKPSQEEPSITPEQALAVFDELSGFWDREKPQVVEARLGDLSIPNLKLIAHELGVIFPTRPSKKALYSGIIGRLNERAMLSKNTNVTPSKRENMTNRDPED
jgi:hypothetical protein